MADSPAVRIFIGSSLKNRIEEKVFVRSLRAHSSMPVEINVIRGDDGSVHMQDGRVLPLPRDVAGGVARATAFSLARFAIPEWCGFEGRAIYCDSDLLAFTDIAALWNEPLHGAAIAAVRAREAICAAPYWQHFLAGLASPSADYLLTSVMLIDCSRAKAWDVAEAARVLKARQMEYTELMFVGHEFRRHFQVSVRALDPAWNCLDRMTPGTRLLHFTDLRSQPWLYSHHPLTSVWESQLFEALEAGDITAKDLWAAFLNRGISLRVAACGAVPAHWRRTSSSLWRSGARLSPLRCLSDGLARLERKRLPNHVWRWRPSVYFWRRLQLLYFAGRHAQVSAAAEPPIVGVLYSLTCERVLGPVLLALAKRSGTRVEVFMPRARSISRRLRAQLRSAGCHVDYSGTSILRACSAGPRATALLALDHTRHYRFHRTGIVLSEVLGEQGVSTICLQHGGCRVDSVESLASSASRHLLVWGRATAELLQKVGVPPSRVTIVGNHLHDQVSHGKGNARADLSRLHPRFAARMTGRKLILLATTIQREYQHYPDEQACYRRFLRHFYDSVDFERASVVVRAHPYDFKAGPDLYRESLPPSVPPDGVLVLPHESKPDTYATLQCCDVLVTRCSTVAEEALLLGKRVIGFDLDPTGPAAGYEHLSELGDYRLVHANPADALRNAIESALIADTEVAPRRSTIEALTLALDGRSMHRTVEAIVDRKRPPPH